MNTTFTPPVFKPRNHAVSNDLLNFIKSASEPKADIVNISSEYFEKALGNLNGTQKDRVVSKEEMDELYEMEEELLEHRRFYKNTVNYLLTEIFAEKIRFLVIFLTLFATGIRWVMFYHHNKTLPDSEYMILSFLAMATVHFIILQVMRVPFFSLNTDDFFKEDPKNCKFVPELNTEHTPEILVQQQKNLADLFLKDVQPMMKRAESLNNWRSVWEMIGTFVGYSYIAICLYFFTIRYKASEPESHDAQLNGSLIVSTIFLGIILIPTLLM